MTAASAPVKVRLPAWVGVMVVLLTAASASALVMGTFVAWGLAEALFMGAGLGFLAVGILVRGILRG